MIKRLNENYATEDSDYRLVPGNKFKIDTTTDYSEYENEKSTSLKKLCDLDKIIEEQGEFRKFVYGCITNNEHLPFAD